MGRSFALSIAVLMGLGLLSMSLAQAQDAYGGVASDTGGEVSIRAPKRPVVKRYAARQIRENYTQTYFQASVQQEGSIARHEPWH